MDEKEIQAREYLKNKEKESQNPQPDISKDTYDGEVKDLESKTVKMPPHGFKPIPIQNLPSKGVFYRDNTEIQIRAARVDEIRHFSTIDENDFIDVNDKIYHIIEKCVNVRVDGQLTDIKDILEIDILYILLAIRDITFGSDENKLQMNISCNSCGHNEEKNITKESLKQFNLSDKLTKYFDPETKGLTLKLKSGGELNIYMPTIGIANFIKNYTKGKANNNQFIDKPFLNISPYVIPDWRGLNEDKYKEYNNETYGWDRKKMSIVVGVIDMLRKSMESNIEHECTSCGAEVSQPLTFQGGIKSLFLDTDFLDELL